MYFCIHGRDYTYIWNLFDTTKLELMAKMTFNMCHDTSMLSKADVGRVEVFASSNHSKERERELLKGQRGHNFYERSQLQDKLNVLKKTMEIQRTPSSIASTISSLKESLSRMRKPLEKAKFLWPTPRFPDKH